MECDHGAWILLRIYADPFCNSWKDRLPRQNHGTHADGYIAKTIVLTLIAILILIAIDFVNGYRGWSVRYVFTAAIILVDVGIIICMIVNRRNWQSYMMWQIFMILCSIVPVILIFTGIVTAQLFALIAFAFSLFLFLGTLIIGDRRARVELKRRFHVR